MRVIVFTLWSGSNYAPLAEITSKNKKEYCEKNKYTFVEKTSNFKFKHLGFEKIYRSLEFLKNNESDLIFWCGTDTLITNYQIEITDLIDDKHDFFISTDANEINSDSFIIKNTSKAIEFFQEIIDLHDKYVRHPWGEQYALIDLVHTPHNEYYVPSNENILPKYGSITKILSQHMINSYNYTIYPESNFNGSSNSTKHYRQGKDYYGNRGQWKQGDFMIHWPGKSLGERLYLANHYSQYIIK